MKSLRAALLGRMQGPDLLTTWSLTGSDRRGPAQAASLSQRTLSLQVHRSESNRETRQRLSREALQSNRHQDRQEHQTLEPAGTENAGLLETN